MNVCSPLPDHSGPSALLPLWWSAEMNKLATCIADIDPKQAERRNSMDYLIGLSWHPWEFEREPAASRVARKGNLNGPGAPDFNCRTFVTVFSGLSNRLRSSIRDSSRPSQYRAATSETIWSAFGSALRFSRSRRPLSVARIHLI